MSSRVVSSSSTGMAHLNSGFETDLDSFLDLEPNSFSAVPSPAPGKAAPMLGQRPSLSSSSSSFASSHSQRAFSGPSFQYESYKQQTGLPVGGLADTFAVNRARGLQYNSNTGFVMPAETLNIPLSGMDDFNFNRTPSLEMSDMDFDADESPADLPAMFYPSSSSSHFVNPSNLSGQDDSPTNPAPIQRIYPGMHAHQAAQAKAQQAKKQEEMLRQQQQQQQRALAGQRPLPSNGKAPQTKDPLVEESISRLLHHMRQNSVASVEDESTTPTNSFNLPRMKKDEDDMDEDERLLNSEEGKKLSSKERRQLRNKVSARAFRSRRKEYISQLEGEVASRSQELSDLKVQNRQLMEENARLTDLTRMLLSSSSFSSFLNDLSTSSVPAPTQPANSQNQTTAVPRPTPKDVNPHQAALQMQNQHPQIGMAMIPESTADFSALNPPFDGWNSGLASDFQVYSVTEIPEGPVLDLNKLSGKERGNDVTSFSAQPKDCPKIQQPFIPTTATQPQVPSKVDPEVVLDEESFSLYFDSTPPAESTTHVVPNDTSVVKDKPDATYELVVTPANEKEDNMERLERMCAALDATCERLALMSPHF